LRAAGIGAADDAQRRAFREHADRAEEAGGDADLRAVGDDGLLRLATAVGVEDVELEILLLEQARLVADLGDESFPNTAAADRDLQVVLGDRRRSGERNEANERCCQQRCVSHDVLRQRS
jgi:hypothetical protein